MLPLYDWSDQEQSGKRIRGLTDIRVSPLNRVYRGALLRGMDIQLSIEKRQYITPADTYMFGTMLHHFFRILSS